MPNCIISFLRGGGMERYNLDGKGGLFKFSVKSPSKLVKQGEEVELKHFSSNKFLKSKILNVTESTIKIQVMEKVPEGSISAGDHVVLHYGQPGNIFVIPANISSINSTDPFEATLMTGKIEKMKDMIKERRHCVSFPSLVKIIGLKDAIPAVVKYISFGGVKMNCGEDILLEDVVDVTILLDKINKLSFKGRVVRKNKLDSEIEYGIEYTDFTETNNKLLTRCLYDFETMYG